MSRHVSSTRNLQATARNPMKLRIALVATLAALCAAAPAYATVITSGHMDLDIDYSGGAGGVLTLDWRTYTPMSAGTTASDDDYAAAANPVSVPLANTYTVLAGANWTCLGTAGSTVYRLKQNNDPAQVWLGYNTQDIAAADFSTGKVTLNLVSVVSAPAGGKFIMYATNSFGTPTYLLNSTAGACNKTSFAISSGIHNHNWWAFSAAGTYVLRFEATGTLSAGLGGGSKSSGTVDITFQIP